MTIPRVEPGDQLSAPKQNRLIDQVNAITPTGMAGVDSATGEYGAVSGQRRGRGGSPFQYFELAESLAPGGIVQAYPMEYDDDAEAYVIDLTDGTFTVLDGGFRFRGRARGVESGWAGSQGLAILRDGFWQIEWLQPHAEWIVCLVYDKFETDDSFILVDTVGVTSPVDTALLMSAVTQVANIHGWNGGDGQTLQASWNDLLERFDAVQKDCGSGVASGA